MSQSQSINGRSRRIGRGRQRGMTLIVGLILLMMLIVISLVGFRNTTLSERMTGNALDRNISFQSAESSGKEALQAVEAMFNVSVFSPPATSTSLGYYNLSTVMTKGGDSSFWTQGEGSAVATPLTDCFAAAALTAASFSWVSCAATVTDTYTHLRSTNKAQYVIELLSEQSSGGSTSRKFRVTSRSTGGSGDAEVVLQTIYVKTTTP